MSKRRDQDFLLDIVNAIDRVMSYTSDMTYDEFKDDRKTQDAVIRNIEVIGEATKNLSSELRTSYPDVPWSDMAGMRDKLIHHYFGVDNRLVWSAATEELPALLTDIQEIRDALT